MGDSEQGGTGGGEGEPDVSTLSDDVKSSFHLLADVPYSVGGHGKDVANEPVK